MSADEAVRAGGVAVGSAGSSRAAQPFLICNDFPISLCLPPPSPLHVGFVGFGTTTWCSWENLGHFTHQKVPFH